MKHRTILLISILFALLGISLQERWALQANVESEVLLTQAAIPLSQQPLEDERQYTEDAMQCILTAKPGHTHVIKWDGEAEDSSINGNDWFHSKNFTTEHLHHLASSANGRSVVIWLHHLII